jgi:GNAT superfamily N-acetyltransferase/predicted nucleic acid-binding protein
VDLLDHLITQAPSTDTSDDRVIGFAGNANSRQVADLYVEVSPMGPSATVTPDQSRGRVAIKFVTPGPDESLLEQAQALGDSETRNLGLLTREAWREYARAGHILVALVSNGDETDALAGYAAYRTPRQEIALAHLMVAPTMRGQKIAAALVREVRRRHPDRLGVLAKCRRDWAAAGMWPKLGFTARGDRPGRSAQGYPLTDWWLDFGHPNLVTWEPSPTSVGVVMDANVFIDLHGTNPGPQSGLTQEIFDRLDDRITPLVTPELSNELNRNKDSAERARLLTIAQSHPALAVSPDAREQLEQRLLDALEAEPTTTQDRSDLRHVAEAAAAGVSVVVTRDTSSRDRNSMVAREIVGVSLITPAELLTHIDEQENSSAYAPGTLRRTRYTTREATASVADRAVLRTFRHDGERKQAFEQAVDKVAAAVPNGRRTLYCDPEGVAVGLCGVTVDEDAVRVWLGRLRPGPIQPTLAATITGAVRDAAITAGQPVIIVEDPNLHPALHEAFEQSGFVTLPGTGLIGLALNTITTMRDLAGTLRDATRNLSPENRDAVRQELEPSTPSLEDAAPWFAAEHRLWPARVADAPIPTWVQPIRSAFAYDLFGYPPQLPDRPTILGIGREHVYYRGGRSGETPPARILWYASEGIQEVFACSALVDVQDGLPDDLFNRYRRLGVYTREQVRSAATRGRVRAWNVIDTEVFDTPIRLKRLRELADEMGSPCPRLESASRVSPSLWSAILQEGRHGRA